MSDRLAIIVTRRELVDGPGPCGAIATTAGGRLELGRPLTGAPPCHTCGGRASLELGDGRAFCKVCVNALLEDVDYGSRRRKSDPCDGHDCSCPNHR